MRLTVVVDQSWSLASSAPEHGGLWVIAFVVLVVVGVAMLADKRPWVILALGLALILLVPIGSLLLR